MKPGDLVVPSRELRLGVDFPFSNNSKPSLIYLGRESEGLYYFLSPEGKVLRLALTNGEGAWMSLKMKVVSSLVNAVG